MKEQDGLKYIVHFGEDKPIFQNSLQVELRNR